MLPLELPPWCPKSGFVPYATLVESKKENGRPDFTKVRSRREGGEFPGLAELDRLSL